MVILITLFPLTGLSFPHDFLVYGLGMEEFFISYVSRSYLSNYTANILVLLAARLEQVLPDSKLLRSERYQSIRGNKDMVV